MISKRRFLIVWIGGLIAFGVVIWLGQPLAIAQAPSGILDHQAAGNAANIDFIQQGWAAEGLSNTAFSAMVADLIFIGIYGLGCILGGLYFRQQSSRALTIIGLAAIFTGVTFLITDYAETIAQIIQLYRYEGSDALAGLAATMQPIKAVSFVLSLAAVIAGLVAQWLETRKQAKMQK